jgi:exo-beta-1,3-glucanase (GH17 family)
MLKAVSLFTLTVAGIVAAWWWLGAPVTMPLSPLESGEKLYCVSYAPFRDGQSPLDPATKIESWQIEQDLAQLARISQCVRTYSVDFGLDRVPEFARKYGLKVMLGLWVSGHADRTKYQTDIGIALARRFPDVVRAVIVGNEALLRGEIAPEALATLIRRVKAQVPMAVTYADVWEFWLRFGDLASAVDFITVHILPYWEDDPIAANEAANHIDAIRRRMVASSAGKDVLIGEVGWPSAGRMREGALPSPSNQALVIQDVLARGKRENFRVNVIEAYDQPWKRRQEGTVGGHWGLFEASTRAPKFVWGAPVSDHPYWRWQAAGGIALAASVFAAALVGRRRAKQEPGLLAWGAIALTAWAAGVTAGWTVENVLLGSLGVGGWMRSLVFALLAIAAPVVGAAALASNVAAPSFAAVLGPRADRAKSVLAMTLGVLAVALVVLATQSALALAFDPRYRDFPFAPLTAAAVPFVLLAFVASRPDGARPLAETVVAAVLVMCALYIAWNETLANWQALWSCAALGAVAVSLVQARFAPSSKSAA